MLYFENKVITTVVIRPLDDRTAHILFDLRSRNSGFGESCTIVNCISSQPVNVFSNGLY